MSTVEDLTDTNCDCFAKKSNQLFIPVINHGEPHSVIMLSLMEVLAHTPLSFHVYVRPKDPQGRTVIKEETPDGRTTHWVPEIQKADITLQSALF